MDFKQLLTSPETRPHLLSGHFGIEKESQRVLSAARIAGSAGLASVDSVASGASEDPDAVGARSAATSDGVLASSEHPKAFGSRSFHPYIQTDFAETQLELITPVCDSPDDALRWLTAISTVVLRQLPENERIWPQSMPPELPDDEAEIELAALDDAADVAYRAGLAEKYGRRKQMVSGIHYNMELGSELLVALHKASGTLDSYQDFVNACYFKIARNYTRYQWLITYLFGASPLSNAGYSKEWMPTHPVESLRNSAYSYRNLTNFPVRLTDLQSYDADLRELVSDGHLSQMKEFYSPIRLRSGHQMETLIDTGVRYLELRNFDLNPFEPVGISLDDARFIQLLVLYLLYRDDSADYEAGNAVNDAVALENPFSKTAYYEEGLNFFEDFAKFTELAGLDTTLVMRYATRLEQPSDTPAAKMQIASADDAHFALTQAEKFRQAAFDKPFQLPGFGKMELSSQNLLSDAIQLGLSVDILDEAANFLRLTHGEHAELVKNGNMTRFDSLVANEALENKTVTKKLLTAAGFKTPSGREFDSLDSALEAYEIFKNRPIVVKPKSTNMGVGISIFAQSATADDYEKAVRLAFDEDSEILVEDFATGTEYRFLVIDGVTKAVLKRVAANVTGDGIHTVAELVAAKNQQPLRGPKHQFPLEFIQLGELERLTLSNQHLTPDSIPLNGIPVQLRDNSNISTGGDSVDVTDRVDASYKRVAEAAARALDAKITGLDLMIPDLTRPDGDYTIIEANFNPMMSMHLYPAEGTPRRVTTDVLEFLFPELY